MKSVLCNLHDVQSKIQFLKKSVYEDDLITVFLDFVTVKNPPQIFLIQNPYQQFEKIFKHNFMHYIFMESVRLGFRLK